MSRPFAVIGLSMFASLFFIGVLGINAAYVCLWIIGIALIIMLCIKRLRVNTMILLACCTAIISVLLYIGVYHNSYQPVKALYGKEVSISATVKEYPVSKNELYYVAVSSNEVNEEKFSPFGIRLTCSQEPDVKPGDTVHFKAQLYACGETTRFSALNYLSKGIYAGAYIESPESITPFEGSVKPLYYYTATLREGIIQTLKTVLPAKNAALAAAVLIGDKNGIASDVMEDINTVGISHLICVSGLHLSIFGFAVLSLFEKLHFSRKLRYLICAALIFLFMAVCGFTYSVLRAGLMFLVMIAGELLLAEPDSLNSLGFASIIILCNPFHACNIGFIFSFTASLAIITLGKKSVHVLKQKLSFYRMNAWKKCCFSLLEIAVISFCVSLCCLPFSILLFGKVNLIGIIANVLILPFASVLLISAGMCVVFAAVPLRLFTAIAYPAGWICSLLCTYVYRVVDVLKSISFANLSTGNAVIYVTMALILICICFLLLFYRRKRFIRVLCCILPLMFIGSFAVERYVNAQVLHIQVGALKDSVCISASIGDDFILIDAGKNAFTLQTVDDALFASDSQDIDYFILTSDTEQHAGKAQSILREKRVNHVICPQKSNFYYLNEDHPLTRFYTSRYKQITLPSGVNITTYMQKYAAVMIEYNGVKTLFLSSGACTPEALPVSMRTADYLIVNGNYNNTFSNAEMNGIIEITNRPSEIENDAHIACDAFYSTAQNGDILINISHQHSTIGRKNIWQP